MVCKCGKPRKDLPGIDCEKAHLHTPEPFGDVRKSEVEPDTRPIVLWRENGFWRFTETWENVSPDAEVDEEWLKYFYNTNETNQQHVLKVLARKIGMLYEEDDNSGD